MAITEVFVLSEKKILTSQDGRWILLLSNCWTGWVRRERFPKCRGLNAARQRRNGQLKGAGQARFLYVETLKAVITHRVAHRRQTREKKLFDR